MANNNPKLERNGSRRKIDERRSIVDKRCLPRFDSSERRSKYNRRDDSDVSVRRSNDKGSGESLDEGDNGSGKVKALSVKNNSVRLYSLFRKASRRLGSEQRSLAEHRQLRRFDRPERRFYVDRRDSSIPTRRRFECSVVLSNESVLDDDLEPYEEMLAKLTRSI